MIERCAFQSGLLASLALVLAVAAGGDACAAPTASKEPAGEPIPILLDTDIGTAIDDAFALGLIVASEELELRGVTTVAQSAGHRAWMVCRFLTHLNIQDVPVAFGRGEQPESQIDWQIQYRRHPAVVWNRTVKPAPQTAVELMYEKLKAAPGEITIVAIGPLTNIARLLEQHPKSKGWIKRIVVMGGAMKVGYDGKPPAVAEWNFRSDPKAARAVLSSGIPLTVVPLDAAARLELPAPLRERIFRACTPLTYQVQALYQLWDGRTVTLFDPAAVMSLLEGDSFEFKDLHLAVDKQGKTEPVAGTKPNARVAVSADRDALLESFATRLIRYGEPVVPQPPGNRSEPIETPGLPNRVHAFENYETGIERRWWMTGKVQSDDAPAATRRVCRSTLTQDYDARMGNMQAMYSAVVFNPVPGPPMGKNPRLTFRYKLHGDDTIRVQLFSLSNGYHRYLSLSGLPQDEWQTLTVDMTKMRRPDGSGGPLSEDERIDDIQFYVDPRADLLIDTMILYDAAPADEQRPFPKRMIFTGWFDTGKQGREWPGDFEIVPHESPRTWDAAKSVVNDKTGKPWIRLHLRGKRRLAAVVKLRFRCRLSEGKNARVLLVDAGAGKSERVAAEELRGELARGTWHDVELTFRLPEDKFDGGAYIDEIHFLPDGGELWIDDLLLYEPQPEPEPAAEARKQANLDSKLRDAATLYAAFDDRLAADYAQGDVSLATRFDEREKRRYRFVHGIDHNVFRAARFGGVRGGALQAVDVLPGRGRIFFPAQGNLAYRPDGWSGSCSFWINTDPNKLLETSFCDPVQITQKGAHNGGLWIDFPDTKPRDLRLGVFPGLAEGEKPIPESDPQASIIRLKEVPFREGKWHHVAFTWENFDTGRANATASLYLDGRKIGTLENRELAMEWDLEKTGIYVAVNLIGRMDEFALFDRALSETEIHRLRDRPGLLAPLKRKGRPNYDALRQLQTRAAAEPKAPKFPFAPRHAAAYQHHYAKWLGLPREIRAELGTSLVLIPPGVFRIGSPADEEGRNENGFDESPAEVTLTSPFYLSKSETTVGQFRRFVEATGYGTDVENSGGGNAHDERAVWKHRPGTNWRQRGYASPTPLSADHPVVHVLDASRVVPVAGKLLSPGPRCAAILPLAQRTGRTRSRGERAVRLAERSAMGMGLPQRRRRPLLVGRRRGYERKAAQHRRQDAPPRSSCLAARGDADVRRLRLSRSGRDLSGQRFRFARHARECVGVLQHAVWPLSEAAGHRPGGSLQEARLRRSRRRVEQRAGGRSLRDAQRRPAALRPQQPWLPRRACPSPAARLGEGRGKAMTWAVCRHCGYRSELVHQPSGAMNCPACGAVMEADCASESNAAPETEEEFEILAEAPLESRPRPDEPLGVGPTLGWGLFAGAIGVGGSIAVTVVLTLILAFPVLDNPQAIERIFADLVFDGRLLLVASLAQGALPLLAILFTLNRAERDPQAYLGLNMPSRGETLVSVLALAVVTGLLTLVSWMFYPQGPQFIQELLERGQHLHWVAVAVLFVAPVTEEIFFRGFLYRGLEAGLGAVAAVIITAGIWAVIHVQYEPLVMGIIFALGLFFGAVRAQTGSVTLLIVLHFLFNSVAVVESAFELANR